MWHLEGGREGVTELHWVEVRVVERDMEGEGEEVGDLVPGLVREPEVDGVEDLEGEVDGVVERVAPRWWEMEGEEVVEREGVGRGLLDRTLGVAVGERGGDLDTEVEAVEVLERRPERVVVGEEEMERVGRPEAVKEGEEVVEREARGDRVPVGVALLLLVDVGVTVGEGETEVEREGEVVVEAHAVRPDERLVEGLVDTLGVFLPLGVEVVEAVLEDVEVVVGLELRERKEVVEEELLGVRERDARAEREARAEAVVDTVGTAAPKARSRLSPVWGS